MILLPRTPQIRLSACAAFAALSVAVFFSSNSLNQLRLQAWVDIYWRKIPPISAEIRKTGNHTDKEMYEIVHPDPRLGTNCGGSNQSQANRRPYFWFVLATTTLGTDRNA